MKEGNKPETMTLQRKAGLIRMIIALALVMVMMLSVSPAVFATDDGGPANQDEQLTGNEDPSSPEEGQTDGWFTDEETGAVYYYENGEAVTGLRNIENANYYFGEDGVRVSGFVTISGKLYYFGADGIRTESAGWKKIDGAKYYCKGSGVFATAPTKIKSTKTVKIKGKKKKVTVTKLYMFRTDGKLKTTKGLYKYNGKEYFGKGGGVLKTGWATIGTKKKMRAVFFRKKNGQMAKNTTVGHLRIPKSGRLGRAYALGVKQLDKNGWTLRSAYKYSYKLRYYGRWWRQKTAEKYAIRGFTTGGGNCYVMASTFYIQAKLLGYNVHQVEGKVAGTHPHSWTVIKHGKKEWVYDPNFRNETGRNGWKIYYGKSGTWRYTNYHKMN